jgi:hypothetical protein
MAMEDATYELPIKTDLHERIRKEARDKVTVRLTEWLEH